jgi:rubredoxin
LTYDKNISKSLKLPNRFVMIVSKGDDAVKQYTCTICGYLYDEAAGIPDDGIAAGTLWQDVPKGWVCPLCKAAKQDFIEKRAANTKSTRKPRQEEDVPHDMRALSAAELSVVFSNLGKGCEKQYLSEEASLFKKLSDYYKAISSTPDNAGFASLQQEMTVEVDGSYPVANDIATENADRGALRALAWSEKATRMLMSILRRYETDGDALLPSVKIYVCDICGFVFVGEEPPEICPICKVPAFKILPVQRR